MGQAAARTRLGVVVLLPEPLASHVQAWRRALREPGWAVIGPHVTLVPPQGVREADHPAAVALVERAAAAVAPAPIRLAGAATFLPVSPVAYLAVGEGAGALAAAEAALRHPPLERRTHPFHPHVTVAQELPAEELAAAARDLAGFRATFRFEELTIMEEARTGGAAGKRWRPLRSIPLRRPSIGDAR